MKTRSLTLFTTLLAVSISAADPTPKDDVAKAIQKLEEKTSYTWKSTPVVPDDAPFKPTSTVGKTEKGGFTLIETSMMENEIKIVTKGDKGVVSQDGQWKTFADLDKEEGPARFAGIMARGAKTPAKEAARILALARDLKKDGDTYSGELTDDGAKELQKLGPGDEGPTITNAKGSVKFWVTNGELPKYQFKLKGTIGINGNEFQNERTTTVEVKDVGTTIVAVPEAAKENLK